MPRKNNADKFKLLGYYTLYSILHITNMMLLMTMNGWLILIMVAASTATYYFLYSDKPKMEEECCH